MKIHTHEIFLVRLPENEILMNSFADLSILSDDQVKAIREATERILERTGFQVHSDHIRKIARKAGAVVDDTQGIVRIPIPLLREALKLIPSIIEVRGCAGDCYQIGDGITKIFSIVTDPWIIDYNSQTPRHPNLQDVLCHTILTQKIDHVVCVSLMDYPVTDYTDPSSNLRAQEIHLLNHTKHNMVYATSQESYQEWLKLGEILSQGRDLAGSGLLSSAVAILSPLMLTDTNGEILRLACEHQSCVIPTTCPMAGTTAPYSVASTLLMANCEAILLAALTQLIRPGNPYLYAIGPSVTDMRSGRDLYYTLDKGLWKIAGVQLAKSYGIPCSAEAGGTMTFRYDQQNGAEGMLFMLQAYCSGADILAGLGSCHNANGMSAEMMLIQTSWLESAGFMAKGINFDPKHLAEEAIHRAGPGKHYLDDDLTLELLRSQEFFHNNLLDYSGGYEESLSLLERAHLRVEELTSNYTSPVPEPVQEGLRRYFHDRYHRLGVDPHTRFQFNR